MCENKKIKVRVALLLILVVFLSSPFNFLDTSTSNNEAGTVNEKNFKSSEMVWSYTTGNEITSVAISSDGQYIVAGSTDNKVYLFDKASSTPLWSYTTGNDVSSVAISSDGQYIATGSRDYKIYLFDKASSTPLWSYSTGNGVTSVAISSDGQYITAGSLDYMIYIFHKDSSSPQWSYTTGAIVYSVAISSNGQYITVGNYDGKVYLFDKASSTPLWSYTTGAAVDSVAISSDGQYIAAGSRDYKIYLFDKASSTPLWSYTTGNGVTSVAISFNGQYIVAGSTDNKIYLFDKVSSTPLWSYTTGASVVSVAISFNGQYIVAGSVDNKVYLFDKASSTPLWNYITGNYVGSVAISSDGHYMTAGSADFKIYFFDNMPGSFTLSTDADYLDLDGIFSLNWTDSFGATNYSVYHHSSYINEINESLSLIADEITDLSLMLSGYSDGTYYFIVVAHNQIGDTLSNCISVIVQLPFINIFTPENKIYIEPMSNYYPATYGFENDLNGGDAKDWVDISGTCQIIENFFDHSKVYEIYDPWNDGLGEIRQYFDPKGFGTIEGWLCSEYLDRTVYLSFWNQDSFGLGLRNMGDGTHWGWYNETDLVEFLVAPVVNNEWFHFTLYFETTTSNYHGLNQGEAELILNDQYSGIAQIAHIILFDNIRIATGYSSYDFSIYVDAVGYSWDLNYNIGDNLKEGLVLSYDSNILLEWMGYSLDGQANRTISGNTTIPMPSNGIHAIQVFGNDTLGVMYESDVRYFTIDSHDLPPSDFVLSSNAGDPDGDGIFDLFWTISYGASNYSVYQHSSIITEINGSLALLAEEITDSTIMLSGYSDGTYYFIVVARNEHGETFSNCISAVVGSPPGSFILSSNAGTPDYDGNFDLMWTVSDKADNYSIYRHSNYITEINGSLTPLALQIDPYPELRLGVGGFSDGTYYLIVVAHNDYGDTLSNCIQIIVELKSLTIIYPDNYCSWETGTSQWINWTCIGTISNVKLELFKDGVFVIEIVGSTSNDGEYYWVVFSGLDNSDHFQIKIIDVSDASLFSYSDYFEIKGPPSTPPAIPGYNSLLIIAALGVTMVLMIKRRYKDIK